MKEDNSVEYRNPGIALPVTDALTEVLRRRLNAALQRLKNPWFKLETFSLVDKGFWRMDFSGILSLNVIEHLLASGPIKIISHI